MFKHTLFAAFLFLISSSSAFAANTTGHAWSESVGWFDFSNATVSDASLSGYAYNDNTGWLVLDGVTNSEGRLEGYAWSESVGYFDFSDVQIVAGNFEGYAYNDNTGWLSFETGTNVVTTWEESTDPGPQPDPEEEEEDEDSSGSSGQKRKKLTNKIDISVPDSVPPQPITVDFGGFDANILSSSPDMDFGLIKEEVRILQRFLNAHGFTVNENPAGPGSVGNETNYFGTLTQRALAKFQTAHGIMPSAGYFGPKTRAFIKSLANNI